MGWRKQYGGAAETMLNKLVDDNIQKFSTDKIKEELHEQVDKLVDKHMGGFAAKVGHMIKADVIDLLDGEDDIPSGS